MIQSYTRGLIAGMELAMRICRNRERDCVDQYGLEESRKVAVNEVRICVSIIRLVQVEIGSGRSPLPKFTLEEQDEMNRIR